jgi:hypothetical protein
MRWPRDVTFVIWHDVDGAYVDRSRKPPAAAARKGAEARVCMKIWNLAMLDTVEDALNEAFEKIWGVYGKYIYVDIDA